MLKNLVQNLFLTSGFQIKRLRPNDIASYVEIFGKESVQKRQFYNISAGGHFGFGGGINHPCWTNVDVVRRWKKGMGDSHKPSLFNPLLDIAHDLLSIEPLPIESESAELVHSRLTIEHIPNDAAHRFFEEVWRILRVNGAFRVVAPNIDLDFRARARNDWRFFPWAVPGEISIVQAIIIHVAKSVAESTSAAEGEQKRISDAQFLNLLETRGIEGALDFCTSQCSLELQKTYRSHHINWWNPTKLEKMLRAAGFKTVYLSGAGQSCSPVLRNPAHFDNVYRPWMMYMEAVKD